MWILIAYDVSTVEAEGRTRLRRIARICEGYGLRVQRSLFEVYADPATWVRIRGELLDVYAPTEDSLRFYHLGADSSTRTECHGISPVLDLEAPLIY
ncbi:MAG TPA: CRISPR-associated endonuclease Cas2 [Myxococcota bacterium]|nr:CRISPR-associated endonuclease Cas2 [Myxococcota bacterium]